MFPYASHSFVAIIFLTCSLASVKVSANCSRAVDEIYNEESITSATTAMLEAYINTCDGEGYCTATGYEESVTAVNKLLIDSGMDEDFDVVKYLTSNAEGLDQSMTQEELEEVFTDQAQQDLDNIDTEKLVDELRTNTPPITLDADVTFDSFTTNSTYVKYVAECTEVGVPVTPVDVEFKAKGAQAFESVLGEQVSDGIDVDVDIKLMKVPICLPKDCDEVEDLSGEMDKLLVKYLTEAYDSNEVSIDGLSPAVFSLLSLDTFCNFGLSDGLDECRFTAVRSSSKEVQSNGKTDGKSDGKTDGKSDGMSWKSTENIFVVVVGMTSLALL